MDRGDTVIGMKDKEIMERAGSEMAGARVKLDTAADYIRTNRLNWAVQYMDEAVNKVRNVKALLARLGEDSDNG